MYTLRCKICVECNRLKFKTIQYQQNQNKSLVRRVTRHDVQSRGPRGTRKRKT